LKIGKALGIGTGRVQRVVMEQRRPFDVGAAVSSASGRLFPLRVVSARFLQGRQAAHAMGTWAWATGGRGPALLYHLLHEIQRAAEIDEAAEALGREGARDGSR
jgi:hypothetical protein